MALLDDNIEPNFDFKNYGRRVAQITSKHPGVWGAFYFYDDDPDIHVNEYPNVNINFGERGMDLSLNAETKQSVKRIISRIKKNPEEFDKIVFPKNSFHLSLFYKLQYRPLSNFVWNLIPGFPKEMANVKSQDIISVKEHFEKGWGDYKNTVLYEMRSGIRRHPSGRFFNEKELEFARKNNPRPNYVIRITKSYPVDQIAGMKKKIIPFFKAEIMQLKEMAEFVNGNKIRGG